MTGVLCLKCGKEFAIGVITDDDIGTLITCIRCGNEGQINNFDFIIIKTPLI